MHFGDDIALLREIKLELPNDQPLPQGLKVNDLEEVLFALVPFLILRCVCSLFNQALYDIRGREDAQHGVDMVLINQLFIQSEACFLQVVWLRQFVQSYQDILLLSSYIEY